MGGPWRELLQVIAHRMVHHVEGIGSLGETLDQAIPLLAEEPLAPFRELCTELVCVAVSFCGHCFWSWSWLRQGYPAQWRWVLDTLLKGVSPDAAAWFVRASCEEGEVPEAEVDRAHGLVPLETTITRDWGHASAILGVHAISVHSAECMRRVIFTARALWELERTPWPLHSPVKDACLEDPAARVFVLRPRFRAAQGRHGSAGFSRSGVRRDARTGGE